MPALESLDPSYPFIGYFAFWIFVFATVLMETAWPRIVHFLRRSRPGRARHEASVHHLRPGR